MPMLFITATWNDRGVSLPWKLQPSVASFTVLWQCEKHRVQQIENLIKLSMCYAWEHSVSSILLILPCSLYCLRDLLTPHVTYQQKIVNDLIVVWQATCETNFLEQHHKKNKLMLPVVFKMLPLDFNISSKRHKFMWTDLLIHHSPL